MRCSTELAYAAMRCAVLSSRMGRLGEGAVQRGDEDARRRGDRSGAGYADTPIRLYARAIRYCAAADTLD
eukprot:3941985-Rhodomonas_salina.4